MDAWYQGANLGKSLSGIGALATAYGTYRNAKAQEDIVALQKEEMLKKNQLRGAAQAELDGAMASVWATPAATV